MAGLRRAVMGSDLAIDCRTVMKKRICTWVECWRRLYSAAVRSASERTLNPTKHQRGPSKSKLCERTLLDSA